MSRAHAEVHRPSSALEGLRVLDLTWSPAGAIVTMFLADHGAEVVRVDRPGTDPARRVGACKTWDRGKRSVVLDLHRDEDGERLRMLALTADVIVDGLGRSKLDRLGCSFTHLQATNPAVVYCALSGAGPDEADEMIGYDLLAAAKYGVMAESPGHREGPIFPGHPGTMYATALVAVIGTLAALRARVVTGDGDLVDVSNRDGVLALMTMNWWSERGTSFIDRRSLTGRLHGSASSAARQVQVRRWPLDPGAHRSERGVWPGDGGLRAG
jgi:crotonobetainyl-CoA:carnitine CoA-transferase CaiB-like acyl-CoA transferase